MRKTAEHFGDLELSLIYVARKLKEALRLEERLTASGIDYLVESDQYSVGSFFRSRRTGAFFYVAPEQEQAARDAIVNAGLRPVDINTVD